MSKNDSLKIIIRMPNYLGDSIMAMFAIELLNKHYKNASFIFVGQSFLGSLFLRQKFHYKVIISKHKLKFFDRIFQTIKLIFLLRKERYNLGLLFQNSFLNALIFRCSRINKLIGYNKENRKLLLNYSLNFDRESHYVNRFAHLVNSYLNKKYDFLPEINLYPQENQKIFFPNNNPIIGVYYGADTKNNYPHIRVPSNEKAIEITNKIAQNRWNIVFFGDSSDDIKHELCTKNIIKSYENILNLSGKTSIRELIDGIFSVDVLVTIDSAMMHIAAYVNTPLVVILGKSSSAFDLVKPKTNNAIFIRKENKMIDESKYIENIDSEEVVKSIKTLIHNKTYENRI